MKIFTEAIKQREDFQEKVNMNFSMNLKRGKKYFIDSDSKIKFYKKPTLEYQSEEETKGKTEEIVTQIKKDFEKETGIPSNIFEK